MKQKRKITKETVSAAQSRLYYASLKLRGIAYLLLNQTEDPCSPLNLGEIQEGVGLIVEEAAKTTFKVWRILDEYKCMRLAHQSSMHLKAHRFQAYTHLLSFHRELLTGSYENPDGMQNLRRAANLLDTG